MKKFLISGFIAAVTALCITGCSEKAEQVSADEMALQMEAANAGREAAKTIINREWRDSMELQSAILEARSISSKYEIDGHPEAGKAFNDAFVGTIRTTRPDLAKAIEGE